MTSTVEKLKQALVDQHVISLDQLHSAEKEAMSRKESLGRVLVNSGFLSEDKLARFMAEQTRIPCVDLRQYSIDPRVLELIPERMAHRSGVLPLFIIEDVLTVATADPLDLSTLDFLSAVTGHRIEAVIAPAEALREAIDQWYGVGDARRDLIGQLSGELIRVASLGPREPDESSLRDLHFKAEEDETVQAVNQILVQAFLENASDIHLEPRKDKLEVRFRIGGVLFPRRQFHLSLMEPIAARLKLLAGLELGGKRVPRDGRVRLSVRNQLLDLQVSVFPALYGESIVLRIARKAQSVPEMTELGLSTEDLEHFRDALRETRGLILVSGPSGSGKTTTMYAALKLLLSEDRSIMTVEELIEYELEGAIQGQAGPHGGITYAEALNAMLRQDPDVIYVGDIQDFDTAGLVVRAALTGQLVLAAQHGRNCCEGLAVLYDMGMNSRLLGSALIASLSQRLVRQVCERCKKEYQPPENEFRELGLERFGPLYHGQGCKHCSGTGYHGVTGVFELFRVNREARKAILLCTSEEEVMVCARAEGMKSFFHHALTKVKAGITTLEELKKVACPHARQARQKP